MKNTKNPTAIHTVGVALALLAASLVAPVAEAGWVRTDTATYTYTSPNYSTILDGADVNGTYTTSEHQSFSITLANPLDPGLVLSTEEPEALTLISWTFDDGRSDGNGSFTYPDGFQAIAVGTNGSGEITDWIGAFYSLAYGGNGGGDGSYTSSANLSCGGVGCVFFQDATEFGFSLLLSKAFVTALPFTWDKDLATYNAQIELVEFSFYLGGQAFGDESAQFDGAIYREVNGVPEPGALALVCAGLMGTLAARRRARRQA